MGDVIYQENRLHHPHLDWSVCKFQAHDRYRKSRYSPHTSDVHAVCLRSILSSLSYTLDNKSVTAKRLFRNGVRFMEVPLYMLCGWFYVCFVLTYVHVSNKSSYPPMHLYCFQVVASAGVSLFSVCHVTHSQLDNMSYYRYLCKCVVYPMPYTTL